MFMVFAASRIVLEYSGPYCGVLLLVLLLIGATQMEREDIIQEVLSDMLTLFEHDAMINLFTEGAAFLQWQEFLRSCTVEQLKMLDKALQAAMIPEQEQLA